MGPIDRLNEMETTMKARTPTTLFVSVAGIALMGAVAGCAPNATSGSSASGAASPSASGETSGTSSAGSYKDGTYSADGNYVSPNGQEKIGVTLTLSSGVVSDLKLTSYPSNPSTEKFQGEFIDGVNAIVVGKPIDELQVSKVSGSSLTSGGFNAAIDQIKKEATN